MVELPHGHSQRVGDPAPAQDVVNVHGRVHPVAWVDSVSYRLNGVSRVPLSLGPTAFRLHRPGDFNVEIPVDSLTVGANTLEILEVTRSGRERRVAVTLDFPGELRWPLPYRHDLRGLPDATAVSRAVAVVDGPWLAGSDGIRPAVRAYDRAFAVGDPTWERYEVAISVRLRSASRRRRTWGFPSGGCGVGIGVGWRGHTDWGDLRPRRGYLPVGNLLWVTAKGAAGRAKPGEDRFYLQSGSPEFPLKVLDERDVAFGVGRWYTIRFAYDRTASSPYRAKMWASDEAEPEGWMLSAPSLPGENERGGVVVVAHNVIADFAGLSAVPLQEAR